MVILSQSVFVIRDRTDHHLLLAKQRASILWLIGKANNNKIPDDLKDPYYKDHDDQDQLKPVVVHALASAEYYCLALGCIYADPNYHNLNHWGVIQALARKGVYVAEPSDVSLTETVLIQTSPIRMSAHMAVIEAIMSLYLKETITIDRIVNAVRRLVPTGGPIEMPGDIEEALIVWINKVCVKMKHRIEDEMNIASPEVQKSDNFAEKVAPPIPLLQDLGDLSDGCCLAAVVSYYCPVALHWQDICLNDPISMADSLYNLQLVQKFCREHLPYDISFLTLEDLIYQHSSVRQNVLVFLAELFFTFEVRPAKCVKVYGSRPETTSPEAAGLVRRNGHYGLVSSATKRSFQQPVSPIPDLRNSYNNFPDTNRISPKGSAGQREPLLPRRQLSQHERMQDRSKRFSFTDGSRAGLISPSGSMRRTHSMQDIDKNGAEKPYVEANRTEPVRNTCSELIYPLSSDFHGYSRKGGRVREDQMQDDGNELYLRPLPGSRDGEPLMPAIVRPSKEKTNTDSKPEEMGEHPRQNSAPPSHKSRLQMKRTSVTQDDKEERQQLYDGGKSAPEHFDSRNISEDFYSNRKSDSAFTYPDNRDLEESFKSTRYSKMPFTLKSDDIVRLKQGLEGLGANENNVYVDQELRVRKDGQFTTSFAQLSKPGDHQSGGINIVYMQHDRDADTDGGRHPRKSSFLQKGKGDKGDKKTSFAALPNQTTWQQHQQGRAPNSHQSDSGHETPSENVTPDAPLASQLYDVKLKLEDKRRHIEQEKRKMELMMSKSRQKVGKAAFLQAVSRNKGSGLRTPDSGAGDEVEIFHDMASQGTNGAFETNSEAVGGMIDKERYSPSQDIEEDYSRSIDQLNTSLGNLQADIQRLTIQQEQIQQLMKNGAQLPQQPDSQGQFYLHDHAPHQESSTWMVSPQQRTPPQETLYQGMQRSQSIEQLYQPLNVGQSMEPLYQPMRRSQSKEQLYQAPLQRTASREQLYQAPLQRTASREQLYQAPLQRSASREQLYQPPLQRTASREQLYQPQSLLHLAPSSTPLPWVHHITSDMSGRQMAVVPQQHAYVDQSGYILHQQSLPMNAGYQMAPQYLSMGGGTGAPVVPMYPNGLAQQDQYGHYGQYPQHMLSDAQSAYASHMQSSPYRLHIEVPGAPMPISQMPLGPHGPSSRSQSPMTFIQHHHPHQSSSQPSSRPPSRPPSVPTVSGSGLQAPSLPSKALPITAPPESYMEPQLVHFIDAPDGCGGDNELHNHFGGGGDELTLEQSRALASLDEAISGTGTYRVKEPMSPTRPTLGKTFRVPKPKMLSPPPSSQDSPDDNPLSPEYNNTQPIKFGVASDKGFFVSFDGEQPKRPKPPLRTKKVPKVIKSEDVTPEKEQAPDFPISPYREQHLEHVLPSKHQAQVRAFDSPAKGWKTPVKSMVTEEKGGIIFDERGDSEPEHVESVEILSTPKGDVGNIGLYIGSELVSPNPADEDEMARKKERILMSVIKRKEQQEVTRARKELEAAKRREQERAKQELLERKKEEDRARRKAILEQYMQRKAAMEEQEGEKGDGAKTSTLPKSKGKPMKPRPKSLHESALSAAEHRAAASRGSVVTSGMRGSQSNLAGIANENADYGSNYRYTETDSGLGRATPPRRAPSPGQHHINRHPSSPTAYVSPPSLPPGLVSRRMGGLFSDTASDSCSTTSSTVEYTGPKLFKQPTAKSNRGIVINAINTVLAGAVNGDSKRRALEEIARSDSKHFLILFRDAGCQFRGLYSYQPERDEVFKLFGTGPRQVTMKMFDKFFKYNCGGRNFTEIQTKHLTVTIDAFTIQNNLWQGKKVVPSKKEFY